MSKLFNLAPRKPSLSEEAVLRLENAVAARGEGVAGQGAAVITAAESQPRELASSLSAEPTLSHAKAQEPVAELVLATEAERKPLVATPADPVDNATSSRARRVTKPPSALPTTGVGTMHNPRVRTTDGVKTRSTTVHLPIELGTKLAVHCAMTGRRLSDVMAEALRTFLADD